MNKIQENSFCFIDYETDSQGIIRHMCLECHKTHNMGWYWPGHDPQYGYGNDDIECWFCKKLIYKHEETKTDL